MRWRRAGATIAALVAGLAGCSSSSSPATNPASGTPTTTTGSLVGRLLQVGGPALPNGGTRRQPIRGYVRVFARGRLIARVAADRSGRFSIPLAPGSYHVFGAYQAHAFPRQCRADRPVTVRRGVTTRADVICNVP